MLQINTPFTLEKSQSLAAGDQLTLSGTIYTARDAAHKRLASLIENGLSLPFDLTDGVLYYTGPTPAPPGKAIGSAGPTTSSRMDKYTPLLIGKTGLKGIIGKGNRNNLVIDALQTNGCTYFAAIGGAGALLSKCITGSELVCYEDLGPEAIYKLEVCNFPLIVAIDHQGRNLFVEGPAKYCIES
jgi:fumarate hydratase subunit beta